MKLTIEVEVPDATIEEMQQFVIHEDDLSQAPETINAVDIFIAMWMSGNVDYTVTKAEMKEDTVTKAETLPILNGPWYA